MDDNVPIKPVTWEKFRRPPSNLAAFIFKLIVLTVIVEKRYS